MKLRSLPTRKTRPGFTLTEMLVVVAIIVVLAAVAIPISMSVYTQAKIDIATANMKGPIRTAVIDYCRRYGPQGDFPSDTQQLLGPADGGKGMLTRDIAFDPWGRSYTIEMQNDDPDQPLFTIISQGAGSGQLSVSSTGQ